MITLPDAFKKFKSRLELNERERKNASKRQTEVREFLDTKFQIDRSFLTGGYKRRTRRNRLRTATFSSHLAATSGTISTNTPMKS